VTIDTGRLRRAVWLEAKPIDVDTWRVRGGTADHMVELVDGRCYCDCVDAQVRGSGCKHSLLVRLLGGDPAVALALRQLVPAPDDRSARRRTRPDRPKTLDSGTWAPDGPNTAREGAPQGAIPARRGTGSRS
jgi:hypothetical protein